MVGGGFNFLFNVFNGFIITYPEIPRGWKWMNRIVPPTWILYGLGVSQLGNKNELLIYAGAYYSWLPALVCVRLRYKCDEDD